MKLSNYKYLILRRVVQIGLLFLYFAGNMWGWTILKGDISGSLLFNKVPLNDPFAILQMFAAGAIVGVNALVGALIIALFYAIIGGRAFCSWVCPVNLVTDLAAWFRRKLLIDKIERKVWISRNIRYYVLVLALIVSAIAGLAAFEVISPITILNRNIAFLDTRAAFFGLGSGLGFIAAIFLFDLFVVKNGWCGHICPLGGFYSVIGKYAFFRVKHNSENCTLCMKCKEVCPEVQVLHMIGKKSIAVNDIECTNCGRCIDVCDDDALGFVVSTYIKKSKESK
jgi:ferredoxin-type protein NapH